MIFLKKFVWLITKFRVLGKVLIELNVGLITYSENFLILDQISTAIFGSLFFIKNQIVIDSSNKLLYFPAVTLSLNSKGNPENSRLQVPITVSKTTLKPNYQDNCRILDSQTRYRI